MKTLLLLVILAASVAVAPAVKPVPSGVEGVEQIRKRADDIILPKIEYRGATVVEIVAHLNRIGKDTDPDKVGVPIELSPTAKASETKITLSLQKVPLIEVIKYVTNLANLKFKITSSKLLISSLEEK